jgi:hypothetical protein
MGIAKEDMQSEQNKHEQEELAQQAGQGEPELSDTWRELLGLSREATASAGADAGTDAQAEVPEIPTLSNDPWAELQRGQGIEIVDLQQLHPQPLNDLDLEQALQLMQEQSAPGGQEK